MWRTPGLRVVLTRLRQASLAPLPVLGLLAAVGPLAVSAGSARQALEPAEAAYRALPELPPGSSDHTVAGAECATDDLAVSWTDPGDTYTIGARVTPIGPAPDTSTLSVNGIVVCAGST